MSPNRPTLESLEIPQQHQKNFLPQQTSLDGGALTPDCQASESVPVSDEKCLENHNVGSYLLTDKRESSGPICIYDAIHCTTRTQYICKVVPIKQYRDIRNAYWKAGSHDHITEIADIVVGVCHAHIFFQSHFGDLHFYVRNKRRLRESEASTLMGQMVDAVSHCHSKGIVLRDIKLRKFVFVDSNRTKLALDGLEDCVVLKSADGSDVLKDKHGCPAYVSPEIISPRETYSGRAADIWSLGIILYTMLVGRYPFHDQDASALFLKIRRGSYNVPDSISSKAKCLLRNMLRRDPSERLSASDVSVHPWLSIRESCSLVSRHRYSHQQLDSILFNSLNASNHHSSLKRNAMCAALSDQVVPEIKCSRTVSSNSNSESSSPS